MDHQQLLTTLAEVAVTLAALSGVAGVLGPHLARSPIAEGTRILLRDVAIIGLVAAFLSFLPLLFGAHAPDGISAWRWLSGFAVGYWVLHFFDAFAKMQRLSVNSRRQWAAGLGTVVGLALFSWNVFAPDHNSPARYIGGVLCLLVVAGSNFVVAVYTPSE